MMGSSTRGIFFLLCTLFLGICAESSNEERNQPNPCSVRPNNCLGFMYCDKTEKVCKPYGTGKLGENCTKNMDCGGEFEYCDLGSSNPTRKCSCLFGPLAGPCLSPIEGSDCISTEFKFWRRDENEVDECTGKGSVNFRCHAYAHVCYCIGKHDEVVADGAPDTRKQNAWFNPQTRMCEGVPAEGTPCASNEDDACQTKDTKMECTQSKCTCPKGTVQYGGVCRKVRYRDICQASDLNDLESRGIWPPGTDPDMFCDNTYRCRCKYLQGDLGEGVPEQIGSKWNSSSGKCEWGQYEQLCYYNKKNPIPEPGVKKDTCDDTKGLKCRQRSQNEGYKCLCHENYVFDRVDGSCPLLPGQKCVTDGQCYESKKCDRGICACPKGQTGVWSIGFKKCIPNDCDYDIYGSPECSAGDSPKLNESIFFLASLLLAVFHQL